MTDFYQINILPRKLLLKRTLSCVLRETNLFYWCHQRISQSCLSKSVSMEIYKNSCSSKNNCFPCSWYHSWIYSTFETLLFKLFLNNNWKKNWKENIFVPNVILYSRWVPTTYRCQRQLITTIDHLWAGWFLFSRWWWWQDVSKHLLGGSWNACQVSSVFSCNEMRVRPVWKLSEKGRRVWLSKKNLGVRM